MSTSSTPGSNASKVALPLELCLMPPSSQPVHPWKRRIQRPYTWTNEKNHEKSTCVAAGLVEQVGWSDETQPFSTSLGYCWDSAVSFRKVWTVTRLLVAFWVPNSRSIRLLEHSTSQTRWLSLPLYPQTLNMEPHKKGTTTSPTPNNTSQKQYHTIVFVVFLCLPSKIKNLKKTGGLI